MSQVIRECETRHKPVLHPENQAEQLAEDTIPSTRRSPGLFLTHSALRLMQEMVLIVSKRNSRNSLFDTCIDEQRVGLGVDVLHHEPEPRSSGPGRSVPRWRNTGETLVKVLVYDAIGPSAGGEDIR
ncbi:hypothetical protein C8R45DRAFT_1068773 [Mycena sanguinolenta]|nr:hypothetical protein C8R45DRAFT_1068773 [Mycena sanguinolenta]